MSIPINSAQPYIPFLQCEQFTKESQKKIRNFVCPLCKGICNYPVVHSNNDKTYCKECSLKYYSIHHHYPFSNTDTDESKPIPLRLVEDIIDKQLIFCKNKQIGCEFLGDVKSYRQHLLNECLKEKINCTLEGCKCIIYREFLKEHLDTCEYRKIKCIHCKNEMRFNTINEHNSVCPKIEIECPLQCGERILRENIENHINSICPKQKESCPFSKYGCGFINKTRELVKKHLEQERGHALVVIEYLQIMKSELEKKQDELEKRIEVIEKGLSEKNSNVSSKFHTEELVSIKSVNVEIKKEKDSFLGKKRNSEDILEYDKIEFDNEDINLIEDIPKSQESVSLVDNSFIQQSDFIIQGSQIKCISNNIQYKFVFLNLSLHTNKKTSWSIKILSKIQWIAIGVCDKEQVIKNKLTFDPLDTEHNHGCFLISSMGSVWNCNKRNEDSQIGRKYNKDDTVVFHFIPEEQILIYEIKGFKGKFTQVHPIKNKLSITSDETGLVPCLVFVHANDVVQVSLK